jgi:flagellar hook assembly protein FlgD
LYARNLNLFHNQYTTHETAREKKSKIEKVSTIDKQRHMYELNELTRFLDLFNGRNSMWKSQVVLTSLLFIAASVYADPFSPNVMVLSAPDIVNYDLSGNTLAIPVTVTGTPADVSFCVFTKNKGSSISKVTNGNLGWHYVNRIDTCLYVSPSNLMEPGANTIIWDGRDENGAAVPPGEYTYYLFGYDPQTPRVRVDSANWGDTWSRLTILENDEEGMPLANPMFYIPTSQTGIISKWIIGNDPSDATLLETTKTTTIGKKAGTLAILPGDHSKFFEDTLKSIGNKVTRKWTWVPKGNAVRDSTWGINSEYTYTGHWSNLNVGPGVVSDGQDKLFLSNADYFTGTESKLIVLNVADGSEVKRIDISQWWVNLNDGTAGGQNVSGPSEISFRNGLIALGSHATCLNSVMDPYADTADDAVLWVNRNGDYIGDHNWEPESVRPWVCNDFNTAPYKYTTSMDSQGFVIFNAYYTGSSIGLYAPDGTGIAYKTFQGEVQGGETWVDHFCDYGSAYDGIYTYNGQQTGAWFVAHDSFKGVITNQTGVNESTPTVFSVAQNVPNPFNPSTTITFTLAKAGKTKVEVYNVAGQKVDTLLNSSLSVGSHSVTWNASKFSAGMYFYTVKSGTLSKTMKMTLLK